jgi:hypothetical protein
MTKYLYLVFAGIITVSCSSNEESEPKEEKKIQQTREKKSPEFTFKAVHHENVGWGYEIYYGAKLEIDQRHIPAVPGLQGFESKEKAEIAAMYIIEKMKAGNARPTVTVEELDSLGVITFVKTPPPPPAPPRPIEIPEIEPVQDIELDEE